MLVLQQFLHGLHNGSNVRVQRLASVDDFASGIEHCDEIRVDEILLHLLEFEGHDHREVPDASSADCRS